MDLILLKYYFFFIGTTIFIFGLGTLITSFLKVRAGNYFADLFFKLLLGLCCFVTFGAIIIAKGKTILLGLVLIGLLFLIKLQRLKKARILITQETQPFKIFELLEVFLAGTLIYFARYFLSFNMEGLPLTPVLDNIFYAKLSYLLVHTGIETSVPSVLNLQENALYPYHYFELWLNGLLSIIFNANHLINLLLVTYTFLTLLLFIGYRSLITRILPTSKWGSLLSFLFIFYASFLVFNPETIPFFRYADSFQTSAISYPKLLPIYILLVSAFQFFLQRQYRFTVLSLLCLPVLFITVAPAVLATLGFASLLLLFNFDQEIKKHAQWTIFYSILITGFIAGFYFLYGSKSRSYSNEISSSFLSNLGALNYWKTSFNIFAGTTIQFLVLNIIPAIIGVFSLIKYPKILVIENRRWAISLGILVYFISLSLWALSHPLPDSIQLFSNLITPLSHIVTFWLVVNTLKSFPTNKHLKIGVLGGLALLVFLKFRGQLPSSTYSAQFLRSVSSETKDQPMIGAYFKSPDDKVNFFTGVPDVSTAGSYLNYYRSDIYLVNLSVFDFQYHPELEQTAWVQLAGFYNFVKEQQRQHQFVSLAQSQLAYIKMHNIKFLVVTKLAQIPPFIKPVIRKVITDELSGERFILLK